MASSLSRSSSSSSSPLKVNSNIKNTLKILEGVTVYLSPFIGTMAFIGLSMGNQESLETNDACKAGPNIALVMITLAFIAFGLFFYSTFSSLGAKLAAYLSHGKYITREMGCQINPRIANFLAKSSVATGFVGLVFLYVWVLFLLEIKFGSFACMQVGWIVFLSIGFLFVFLAFICLHAFSIRGLRVHI